MVSKHKWLKLLLIFTPNYFVDLLLNALPLWGLYNIFTRGGMPDIHILDVDAYSYALQRMSVIKSVTHLSPLSRYFCVYSKY